MHKRLKKLEGKTPSKTELILKGMGWFYKFGSPPSLNHFYGKPNDKAAEKEWQRNVEDSVNA